MKIKRPTYTEFICTECKCHEKIPTKVVLQLDMMDPGDPIYPPTFYCEKCGGLMKPVYFVGYTGITYIGNTSFFIKAYLLCLYFFIFFCLNIRFFLYNKKRGTS